MNRKKYTLTPRGALLALLAMSLVLLVAVLIDTHAAHAVPFAFSMAFTAPAVPEDVTKALKEVGEQWGVIKELPGKVDGISQSVDGLSRQIKSIRSGQSEERRARVRSTQRVSDECALHIAARALLPQLRNAELPGRQRTMIEGFCRDLFGAEFKSALTASDIPIPTEWSGEVVELVGLYGTARQHGTVYPLGAGTVKLPRLGTDTTFGLIAASGTVTEKSPTVAFVTFTPEKFGGLVRIPTELDDDSIVDVGQFIARYSARQLARAEDYNFWASTGAGSGVNGTAEGLTKNVVTNSKTVALASGDLAPGDVGLAKLRELRTKPDAAALRTGAYFFHPSWEQKFAGLNTAGDKPYMANGLRGATFDGFPINWIDVLPVYSTVDAASTVFGLFGDPSFQYLGVRGGIRFDVSTEAAFATDEILIRALERFTIGLMATGSMAGLITAAS